MSISCCGRYNVIAKPFKTRAKFRDGYWKVSLIWAVSLVLSAPWAIYYEVMPVFTCKTLHRCQVMMLLWKYFNITFNMRFKGPVSNGKSCLGISGDVSCSIPCPSVSHHHCLHLGVGQTLVEGGHRGSHSTTAGKISRSEIQNWPKYLRFSVR